MVLEEWEALHFSYLVIYTSVKKISHDIDSRAHVACKWLPREQKDEGHKRSGSEEAMARPPKRPQELKKLLKLPERPTVGNGSLRVSGQGVQLGSQGRQHEVRREMAHRALLIAYVLCSKEFVRCRKTRGRGRGIWLIGLKPRGASSFPRVLAGKLGL
ncbi:hypothetical protein AMTR_s00029p00143960 [Amborella trichopoda]|uniref:Uncharacterized protein n=1 Tax=Amborella trichopoda TaxID=13333 RepID=W1PHR1_AMBTC|nr:hypothetical protein AMTR_s00029p00143960 [Amborella trichopoda]